MVKTFPLKTAPTMQLDIPSFIPFFQPYVKTRGFHWNYVIPRARMACPHSAKHWARTKKMVKKQTFNTLKKIVSR